LKRNTITLLILVSAFYLFLFTIFRNLVPESAIPNLSLLAIPLVVLALILTTDLRRRATTPTERHTSKEPKRIRARDVQSLTRQLEVAANASPGYFETILRARLRELLAEKVSLEMGIEKETVKKALANPTQGQQLLKDQKMYELLYYHPPIGPELRLQMLREIIDRIEAWKP
jgi:hypothetical protein